VLSPPAMSAPRIRIERFDEELIGEVMTARP
jgi:hypothetical protein